MKRFLKKRWLGLPIGIITVVLLVLVLTGTALAVNGYIFFRGSVDAEVREAIAVGAFDSWDNLHPYGSDAEAVWVDTPVDGVHGTGTGELGDVAISITLDGDVYTLTIATLSEKYVGEGFAAGEWIVIPINLRNGSSVALDLGASAYGGGLILDCVYEENNVGAAFMPTKTWIPLSEWTATIPGYGGNSGSAVVGAKVLFVKITVPQDAIPQAYDTITFSLARGVTN